MTKKDSIKKYPLMENYIDNIKPMSGRKIDEINMKNVLKNELTLEDGRISRETLQLQSEIANEAGYKQVSENMIRAMELVSVPDQILLDAYNAMRPYRATKEELLNIAKSFSETYNAVQVAAFIKEAADVLEQKKMLKGDK